MATRLTGLEAKARDTLGPHWERRLNAMLDTIIDGEGLLMEAGRSQGNMSSAIGKVAEAVREVVRERRYG